jgi:uncharacterized membrane protein
VEVWRARARWVGSTVLLALAISFLVGLYLSDLRGFHGNGSPLENVAAPAFSLAAAVLLRVYWPARRAWLSKADDWSIEHPSSWTIALFAIAFGLLCWLLQRDPIAGVFGVFWGGALGWFTLRREARRRQDPGERSA